MLMAAATIAATFIGLAYMQPLTHDFAVLGMCFCGLAAFFAGTGVRDYSGGRFIAGMGAFVLFAGSAVMMERGPFSEFSRMVAACVIPVYCVVMSCITIKNTVRDH